MRHLHVIIHMIVLYVTYFLIIILLNTLLSIYSLTNKYMPDIINQV